MQAELERHLESVRALENPHDPYLSARQPYYANMSVDPPGPPLSPRQMPPGDDSRRPSMVDNLRPNMIRPPMPSHLTASPRRYGSVSAAAGSSPNHPNRPQIPSVVTPQQPMPPHPLSSASSSSPSNPSLARRHTSADIRQHGWPPPGVSPFPSPHHPHHPNHQGAPPPPPPAWPPSPHRTPNSSDQQVREVLAQYEMGAPRRPPPEGYRHLSPSANEPPSSSSMLSAENGLTFGGSRYARQESSLPATRRSSMASNVHSLLNPADTAERSDEDLPDDRKRKRLE